MTFAALHAVMQCNVDMGRAAQELLISNMAQNLQLVVQVAKEYTDQLGANKIVELLESHKSYHGLYYYLGGYIAFSEDPDVRPPAPHWLLCRCRWWICSHPRIADSRSSSVCLVCQPLPG